MSQGSGRVGFGLYFIDVLACLLFCISLALAGARFARERSVTVDLPREVQQEPGAVALGPSITLAEGWGEPEIRYEEEPMSFEELSQVLRDSTPPAVVVRAEASALARLIATVHAAGVADIQLAYEVRSKPEAPR